MNIMDIINIGIAFTALGLSLASAIIAQRSAARERKANAIKELLGEKETVAFAALRLLRDGLPDDKEERALVLAAVMQACVFEGSDRARALLYRVLDENREKHCKELLAAFKSLKTSFDSMAKFNFNEEELDLDRGRRRLDALEKVRPNPPMQSAGCASG